jgi:hypothetical protein
MSWLRASDEHLAKAQADIDEDAKKIKQLTQQIEQLRYVHVRMLATTSLSFLCFFPFFFF